MSNIYFLKDRRNFPRFRVVQPLTLRSPSAVFDEIAGQTKNVSGSGMLAAVPREVPTGIEVELLFDMPTFGGENVYPVQCRGTVLRIEQSGEQFLLAVSFSKVDIIAKA